MTNQQKLITVGALVAVVLAAILLKPGKSPSQAGHEGQPADAASSGLPKLIDLGAGKCIPCKLMAPILEELKQEYAGRFEVVFIDVWENKDAAKKYGIGFIPFQIFLDAQGKELFRHEGFFGKEDILAKWKELGVNLPSEKTAGIVRETPVAADTRPRESVCFLCDGDVNPKTRTLVKGQEEQRILCCPHCYFIYFSSIFGANAAVEDAKVSVTDWATGAPIAATTATYLYGMDAKGRPTIQTFAGKDTATREQQQAGSGNVVTWEGLRSKELASRCGFCDRAVYPEDASKVIVEETTRTLGCCTHCALGVAARLQKDIEVEAPDGLTGEIVRVRTIDGCIASLEPKTAVAWFGQKKTPEGKWVSAGCFKQGLFVNEDNLKKWLDARPAMTGRQISIAQALVDKMKLSPEQIAKACKLGECK